MPQAPHELTHLDHGVQVATERVPGVRSVSLGIWIPVGSRHEQPDVPGYAHLVEHLLFKGDPQMDALAISEYFDSIGSEANAATTKEHTVVNTRVLDRHLPETIRIFGRMVGRPAFEPGDVDAEREVILEEIAMYDDSPSDVVHELADALVFGDHGLGLPIVGTQASIGSATSEQVKAFHDAYYGAGGLVVSAAGNVDHAELVSLVQQHLTLPAGGIGRPPLITRDSCPASARVVEQDSEQVHVCIAGTGIARTDERRYVLAILDTLLGGTPSSRLFAAIREREGLAYSVYSFISHYADAGQIGAYVGVRPDRLERVLQLLDEEFDALCAAPPTAAELQRAKDHLEGRLLLAMESTGARSSRLGGWLVAGMQVETPDQSIAKLTAVTADDVHRLAQELYARERRSIALVAEDAAGAARTVESVLGLAAGDVTRAVA